MFAKILRGATMLLVLAAIVALYLIYYVYEVKVEGELFLEHAPGKVSIIREADTQILHIKGDDWPSIAYGQGFACAQNRLW